MLEPIPSAGYIEVDEVEPIPVAYWNDTGDAIDLNIAGRGIPLYTHPVKELTDEEIMDLWCDLLEDASKDIRIFARAILRKSQEK